MSGSALDKLKELLGLIKDRAVDLKTEFEEESKFQQMRIVIVGTFLADVIAMLVVAFILVESKADFEVWIESSGPSNLVMIRNGSDDHFEKVKLSLDNKYSASVELKPDANGFLVDVVFADKDGFGPPRSYEPKRLRIDIDGDEYELPIGKK